MGYEGKQDSETDCSQKLADNLLSCHATLHPADCNQSTADDVEKEEKEKLLARGGFHVVLQVRSQYHNLKHDTQTLSPYLFGHPPRPRCIAQH